MLIATLICSDERCAAEHEHLAGDLDELVDAACACGCTLVLLDVSEWEPARLAVPRPVLLAA